MGAPEKRPNEHKQQVFIVIAKLYSCDFLCSTRNKKPFSALTLLGY